MNQNLNKISNLIKFKIEIDQIANELKKNPSLNEINKLKLILKKLDKPSIFLFQKSFINPVLTLLFEPNQCNEQILFAIIEYLLFLNDRSFILLNYLIDLYPALFQLIDVETNSMKGNCLIGEDLKLKVVVFVQSLLNKSNNFFQKYIESFQFRPILGHSIHVLLNLALNENYKRLQVESTSTLNTLICKFIHISSTKSGFIAQDVFASFFPGISIKLLEVVTKDNKISKQLAINCIKTLSSISSLSLTNYGSSIKHCSNESFRIYRSPQWFENSLTKLKIVIEKMTQALIINQSNSVRKELVTFSRYFLFEILLPIPSLIESKNLLILTILQIPLTLLYDNDEDICSSCEILLEEMADKVLPYQKNVTHLILDDFYHFLTRLSREIQWMQEDQKLIKFRLLTGYLKCLSNSGLFIFFTSEMYQQKLFHCLLNCLQFDERFFSSTGHLIVNLSLNEDSKNFELENYPKKHFKWFDSVECELQLKQACLLIGKYLDSFCLIDYFTNIFQESINNSLLYFINSSILEIKDIKLLEPLLEEYTYFFTINSSQEIVNTHQILCTCLLTEGFVSFAHIFGKSKQHYILINVLYHILANIASQNQIISSTSMVALNKLSIEFNYSSAKEIIIDNVDYLINYLNTNLKNFESDRKYLAVMSAIFTLTDLDTLKYLTLTIENILTTLDIYYYIRCDNLVDILNIIVAYIHHQVFKNSKALPEPACDLFESRETRKAKFKENLVSFLKCKKICDTLKVESEKVDSFEDVQNLKNKIENNPEINENDDDQDEKAKKSPLPYHIELIKKILEKCYNLMAVSDVKVRLIVLDIIMKGIEVIKPFEDDLLPLCHKIWPCLVARLKEKNILVIMKAFVCLVLLAKCCGDFLKTRTVSEIIPHLIKFIKTQAKESYKKNDHSSYRFTVEYKLQLQVLSETGLLCFYLNLEGERSWSLIDAFFLYLSKYQPKSLQDAAKVSLQYWFEMDPTTVMFLINRFRINQKTQEFEANIRNLLQKRT